MFVLKRARIYRKVPLPHIPSITCPHCECEMGAVSIKDDDTDDWRYECDHCEYWSFRWT